MLRDDATLLDIVRAAKLTTEFVRDFDREGFDNDLKTQSAVLHQLLVIGEAANRLSAGFCEAHDDVPWRAIIGMRNRLIHGYDDVDLDEVWNTVSVDIPELLRVLEPLTGSGG